MKRVVIAAAILPSLVGPGPIPPWKRTVFLPQGGRTLYVFDKDAAGKSARNGGCAAAWPPFAVANAALAGGDFTIIARGGWRPAVGLSGQTFISLRGRQQAGGNGDGRRSLARRPRPARTHLRRMLEFPRPTETSAPKFAGPGRLRFAGADHGPVVTGQRVSWLMAMRGGRRPGRARPRRMRSPTRHSKSTATSMP